MRRILASLLACVAAVATPASALEEKLLST